MDQSDMALRTESFARLRRADNRMKLFACNKIDDLPAVSKKHGSAGS